MFSGVKTILDWKGRLGRLQFLGVLIVVFIAVTILGAVFSATMGKVIAFLGQLSLIPSQIKRLRDIGWTPWLVILSFVPVVGFILALLLLFVPGKK